MRNGSEEHRLRSEVEEGLAIYLAVGVVVYLIVYLLFFAHGGSDGGLY